MSACKNGQHCNDLLYNGTERFMIQSFQSFPTDEFPGIKGEEGISALAD